MSSPSPLLLIGQLPPPWHGQAVATQMLFEHEWGGHTVGRIRMSYSMRMSDVGRLRLNKLRHLVSLVGRTRKWLRENPGAILFYPPASPQWTPFVRDVIFLWLTRPLAAKTVFIYHAGGLAEWVQSSRLRRWLARRVYDGADLSLEVAIEEPSPHSLFRAKDWCWSPYGIDVPVAQIVGEPKERPFEVLFVGSLQEGKGVMELLKTADLLRRRGHGESIRFKMMGSWFSDAFKTSALRLCKELGVEDMVDFVGQMTGEAKWQSYHKANLFFFPTHYASEAFPIVLIEALGCGLPVVTTKWRGIPSLLEGCGSSTLCDIKNPEAFAEAILDWLRKSSEAEATASTSREFYTKRYLPEHFIGRIENRITVLRGADTAKESEPVLRAERTSGSRKPRIIQVFNHYLERGGEEVWVNEMVNLCADDFEIQELRFYSRAWKGNGAPNRITQALRLWNNPPARKMLREAVMLHQPDVLIFHNLIPVASLGLYEEAALLGIPVIQFAHNFRPFSVSGTLWFNGRIRDEALYGNRWPEILHGAWEGSVLKTALLAFYFKRLAARGTFERVARWVTVSEFMRGKFISAGMAAEKVTALRHCWHIKESPQVCAEQGYYLFLGRLVPEKGVSVMLKAWDILYDRLGAACPELIIAGSGPEEARLHQVSVRKNNVKCVGFVDGEAKERLIASSRAVVAPSIWWEPLGLIVYEAFDHARPVLAAASGGLQETVQPGVTGFLHPPGDAEALAQDVERMEKLGVEGRHEMGQAGRTWLKEQADSARWIVALKDIVRDVSNIS